MRKFFDKGKRIIHREEIFVAILGLGFSYTTKRLKNDGKKI